MPTIKQRKAAKLVVENGGNISKAMIDANYSPNTAHTPQKLTESDGWKELMAEYLPDELIAKKHKALLDKVNSEGEIDVQSVSKGVEMAYKIKRRFDNEGININFNTLNVSIEEKEAIDRSLDAFT